ncbi:unnamed protein product [Calicophoron daubneyi]|uniref:Tubulin-specific chaperone cofactor E-like protein n=1 Tax=Calicophoron daubneyi TaxID=300641 RepID=A0AAV2TA34_CALDB
MTSFVEAMRRKYEKLTECHIFETFVQKSPNRYGANILFPARTLSMDCQQISRAGNEEELIRSAGHVAELDLAGNQLSSWKEIFILLRCLQNLESLNLSQNPLGPNQHADNKDSAIRTDTMTTIASTEKTAENHTTSSGLNPLAKSFTVPRCSPSPSSSPILKFASYEDVPNSDDIRMQLSRRCAEEDNTENRENVCTDLRLPHRSERNSSKKQESVESGKFSTQCFQEKSSSNLLVDPCILSPPTIFPRLSVLALNSTYIPWFWILELLKHFPNLNTLHVALNNYGAEEDRLDGSGYTFETSTNTPVFPRLRILYFSDNGISSWWTVCRLSRNFPNMEQLILLGNPIAHIPAPLPAKDLSSNGFPGIRQNKVIDELGDGPCNPSTDNPPPSLVNKSRNSRLFSSIHTLSLSETLIDRWESIDALGDWMPKLTNLRLGNSLPVFQSKPEAECRAHVIARLPNLTTYNRSAIDSEEREAAEREFVRDFGQVEPALRPSRYWELERRHGRLEPLANIDLSPKRFVRVRVVLGERELWHDLNLNLKVSQAKRQLCGLFGVEPPESRRYKLYYFDQVMSTVQGPEELKNSGRALHSYQPETGDLFELVRFPDHDHHTRD